jgi:hypothetical protein
MIVVESFHSLQAMALVYEEDAERVMAAWMEARAASAARGGEPVHRIFTMRNMRRDGSHFWCEVSTCITPTGWFAITRCVCTLRHRWQAFTQCKC